jgi:hypothetical protein
VTALNLAPEQPARPGELGILVVLRPLLDRLPRITVAAREVRELGERLLALGEVQEPSASSTTWRRRSRRRRANHRRRLSPVFFASDVRRSPSPPRASSPRRSGALRFPSTSFSSLPLPSVRESYLGGTAGAPWRPTGEPTGEAVPFP